MSKQSLTFTKSTPETKDMISKTRENGLDNIADFLQKEIMEGGAVLNITGRSIGYIYGTSSGDYMIHGSSLYPINPYDGEPEF